MHKIVGDCPEFRGEEQTSPSALCADTPLFRFIGRKESN